MQWGHVLPAGQPEILSARGGSIYLYGSTTGIKLLKLVICGVYVIKELGTSGKTYSYKKSITQTS